MHMVHCSGDADAGSEELQEPLLGHDADGTSSSEPAGSLPGSSRALVPHSINRLDWEELWRVLWGNCCEGFAGILGEALVVMAVTAAQAHTCNPFKNAACFDGCQLIQFCGVTTAL